MHTFNPCSIGRQLFDQAMKEGYVESLNIKVIFFGTAGAGKTCSEAVILGLPPPVNRVSTAMAERPVRVVCADIKKDGEWVIMGPEEVKEELAAAIRTATVTKSVEADQEDDSSSSIDHKNDSNSETTAPLSFTIWQRFLHWLFSFKQSTSTKPQQQPSPPSTVPPVKEEAAPITSLHEASSTEDELVKLIDRAVARSDRVARFKWVYFLDTGGQPQFHEVFRAFLKRASLCIFVQKLSERLDEYPLVEYYDDNSMLVGKPYHTAVTHQQILNHCVQTMLSHDSRRDQVSAPKILVVGTHVDKEDQCSETREAKNRKLIELLVPAFPEQVVFYGQDRKQVIFPLNARCPREAEKKVAKEIREVILKQCIREPDKIPLRWYALEQALQELAQKYGREVLKKEECFAAALRLHFNKESFEAALQYLHNLNIIFYYHDILPEFVFCNPQVLLDKVTELVKCSHQLKQEPTEGVACAAEWGKFEAFGLVTEELLGRFCKHYLPGMFSPEHTIKLFKHLLILADLNDTEYFMPSLLQTLEPSQRDECQASCVSACAPFVVFFPDGLPLGMLCSLVVFLLSQENHFPTAWKLEVEPTGNPTCLFRNCIHFVIPGIPGSVALFDLVKFFEIRACVPSELLPEVCPLVRNAIFSGLESASFVLDYSDEKPLPAFLCPCNKSSSHPATISSDQSWWICSRKSNVHGKLQDKHRFWLPRNAQQTSG
jgi:E1A/CREB-binding protein